MNKIKHQFRLTTITDERLNKLVEKKIYKDRTAAMEAGIELLAKMHNLENDLNDL